MAGKRDVGLASVLQLSQKRSELLPLELPEEKAGLRP